MVIAATQYDECAGDLSEDSIFLYDSVIRGHHIFKEIWTLHTFQLHVVVEVKVRVHGTPHLLSA